MRLLAWPVASIFILLIFAPTVIAQSDDQSTSIQINLQPQYSDSNSTIVNMMDENTMRLEKTIISTDLPNIEGKYYGPYLESSLFQFSHQGGYFQFATNFTITPDIIMNGVSSFWVRVPVVPDQYQSWHLICTWGYFDIIDGISGSTSDRLLALPWTEPYPMSYFWNSWQSSSGSVWSPASIDTYQIKQRSSGIYVQFNGIFKPNDQFTLGFTGLLKTDQAPMIYLSQERPDLNYTQNCRFFQPYEVYDNVGTTLLAYGYKYEYTETIGAYPAWVLLFTAGLGRDNMASFKLHFGGTNHDYLQFGGFYTTGSNAHLYYAPGFSNGTYLSFYMPFSSQSNVANTALQNLVKIDWKISIILYDYTEFNRSAHALPNSGTETFWVNNTHNFLLFSTPYPIEYNKLGFWYPSNASRLYYKMTLTPMQKSDIILIGAESYNYGEISVMEWRHGMFVDYRHENELASWNGITPINTHKMPLYESVQFTDNQWVQIEERKAYWVYDFGWGQAYCHPGKTQLYMFLDTGGQLFYNGSYADFVKHVGDNSDSKWTLEGLFNKVKDWVYTVAGWLWDGIVAVWNTLKAIGNWIYSVVSEIVGWIISVVKDIAGKVSNIIEGMLYGAPIMVILFLVNYVGEALYKGHIPKLGKERRLLKKMRPRAILKQRAKYQRKLKYPIVQVRKARESYQEYAGRVRTWRTQRSEQRTTKYESAIHRSRQKELKYQEEKASLLRRR